MSSYGPSLSQRALRNTMALRSPPSFGREQGSTMVKLTRTHTPSPHGTLSGYDSSGHSPSGDISLFGSNAREMQSTHGAGGVIIRTCCFTPYFVNDRPAEPTTPLQCTLLSDISKHYAPCYHHFLRPLMQLSVRTRLCHIFGSCV